MGKKKKNPPKNFFGLQKKNFFLKNPFFFLIKNPSVRANGSMYTMCMRVFIALPQLEGQIFGIPVSAS